VAKRKSKQNVSMLGAVIVAALIGIALAMVMFNDSGTPLPPPPEVEFNEEYDDTWGKLPTAAERGTVSQILVSWTGANPEVTPKEERTEEEARKLIDEIWARYKNEPSEANWKTLQAKHNEDASPHQMYPFPGRYVPQFSETAQTTKVGFARICKSDFGFHLIRREN